MHTARRTIYWHSEFQQSTWSGANYLVQGYGINYQDMYSEIFITKAQ